MFAYQFELIFSNYFQNPKTINLKKVQTESKQLITVFCRLFGVFGGLESDLVWRELPLGLGVKSFGCVA